MEAAAAFKHPRLRLGALLLRNGLLSAEQLAEALEEREQTGLRIGEIVVRRGWVSDEDLARTLAEQFAIDFVDLDTVTPEAGVGGLLSADVARRVRAVPLGVSGGTAVVAVADPTDEAVEALSAELDVPVRLAVAPASAIARAIDRLEPAEGSGETQTPAWEPEVVTPLGPVEFAGLEAGVPFPVPEEQPAHEGPDAYSAIEWFAPPTPAPQADETPVVEADAPTGQSQEEPTNVTPFELRRPLLGTLLLRDGLLTPQQLAEALIEKEETDERLGEIVLRRGWISEVALSRLLAEQFAVVYVDLDAAPPDEGATRLLSAALARYFWAVPVRLLDKDSVLVAIADPTAFGVEDLERALGLRVVLGLATESAVEAAIQRLEAEEEAGRPRPVSSEPETHGQTHVAGEPPAEQERSPIPEPAAPFEDPSPGTALFPTLPVAESTEAADTPAVVAPLEASIEPEPPWSWLDAAVGTLAVDAGDAETTEEPADETPADNADQPTADTDDQPSAEAGEPVAETYEPTAYTYQPIVETYEPTAATEPIAETSEPTVETWEPAADADQEPIVETSEPAADADQEPIVETWEPIADTDDEPPADVVEPSEDALDEPAAPADEAAAEPADEQAVEQADEPPANEAAPLESEPEVAGGPETETEPELDLAPEASELFEPAPVEELLTEDEPELVVPAEPEHDAPVEVSEDAAEPEASNLVDGLLRLAVEEGASDLHFEPHANQLVVRARIDGIMQQLYTAPTPLAEGVVARLEMIGGLDAAGRPHGEPVTFSLDTTEIDARVTMAPTPHGDQVVLRFARPAQELTLDQLGMAPDALEQIARATALPYGAIIAAGPREGGTTTTLYAALRELDAAGRCLMSIEDPIARPLPGVGQIQVDSATEMTFARGLRAILASDPDVVLVGDVRDAETARTAVEAAVTGQLVLAAMRADDIRGAVSRLVDMGVSRELLAAATNCLVAQRLARKLCPGCREPYDMHVEELLEAGARETDLPVGGSVTVYRAVGCDACANGYRGRVAMFETLLLSSATRRLLESGTAEELHQAAVAGGMRTLRQDGLRLSLLGHTSVDEIARVAPASAA